MKHDTDTASNKPANTTTTATHMATRTERRPRFTIDPAGAPVVRVPLRQPGKFAVVDLEDFDKLQAAGLSPHWTLNDSGKGFLYVRAVLAGDARTLVSVAALVMNAGRRQQVTYRDGDRLNLRRANLLMQPRRGRLRAA